MKSRHSKCRFPYLYFRLANWSKIIRLLFPLRIPTNLLTLIFGGIVTSMCIWSLHALASMISTPSHRSHICRNIFPIAALYFPYMICLRYFGANTIWYWHRHFVCAKVFHKTSCLTLLRLSVVPLYHRSFFCPQLKLFPHSLCEWFSWQKEKRLCVVAKPLLDTSNRNGARHVHSCLDLE